ncbi:MAG: ATPase, partial [Bacillota bacterium]
MRVPKFSVNTLIEIAVGAFAAVLTALALEGVSLGPFFILGGLTALVYLTFGGRVGAQAAGGLQGNPTSIPAVKFDDIGGQESAKRELCEGLEFINDPERVRDLGIRPLKGL